MQAHTDGNDPFYYASIFVCIRSVYKFHKRDLKVGGICSSCGDREEKSQSARSDSANETNMFAVCNTPPSGTCFSAYVLPCRDFHRIIFVLAEPLGVGVFPPLEG